MNESREPNRTSLGQGGRRAARRAVMVLALVAAASPSARATDVCGAVCDETWTAVGSPYVATCDVTVASGCTLTVEPGVEVRFNASAGMTVEGDLAINGTAAEPVTFTSNSATPAAGDWNGLRFAGSSTVTIHHTEVNHGGNGLLVDDDATVTLDHVTSRWNVNGIRVEGTGPPSLTATNCLFVENDARGVEISVEVEGLQVDISDSEIHSNLGDHDVYTIATFHMHFPVVIGARNNWWGTTDASAIGARIVDDALTDPEFHPIVDYCAYLDGPGGTPRGDLCPDLTVAEGETVTLDRTDLPYLVTSTYQVEGTLIVREGVEIRFVDREDDITFHIKGDLQVLGSSSSPVALVADVPAPGYPWGGIIATGASVTLQHVIFEDADIAIEATTYSQVDVVDSTIRECRTGLQVLSNSSVDPGTRFTVTDSRLVDNYTAVVVLADSSKSPPAPEVTITNSELHSSRGDHDLSVSAGWGDSFATVFDFRNNWWGTSDPDAIRSRIRDHDDEVGRGTADWCGYLDGPAGAPVRDAHCPDLAVCGETVVWDLTDRPYHLVSDVHVCDGGTLIVDAGVTTEALSRPWGVAIEVEGVLDVNGTPASPVTFTSDAAVPAAGDWRGLQIGPAHPASLDHVEITAAMTAIEVGNLGNATLNGVVLRQNTDGLRLRGQATVAATGSEFVGNQQYGIHTEGIAGAGNSPQLDVTGSEIHSNLGTHDLYLDGIYMAPSDVVHGVRYNWWGTTDTSAIRARIRDHEDDPAVGRTDWCGYLEAAGGAESVHCPAPEICDGTTVWDQTDKPYLLTEDVVVCSSGTLQIESGVSVRVAPRDPAIVLEVHGTLDVNGTSGSPVTFRSDSATPAAGDWTGIQIRSGGNGTLDHAQISHAARGLHVFEPASAVTFDGLSLTGNTDGLFLHDEVTVTGTNSEIANNDRYGVYAQGVAIHADPTVSISQSDLYGNLGGYEVYLDGGFSTPDETYLLFRENWWGTAVGREILDRIHDHLDNAANAWVDWCRHKEWYGGPPTVAACADLYICDEVTVWDRTDAPYLVTTGMQVCPTGTLHIEPGVEVKVVDGSWPIGIDVYGVLEVHGTEASPVLFTSYADTPAAGDWQGIEFAGASSGSIDRATVEYGQYGVYVHHDASVSLDDVTSRSNEEGLHLVGDRDPGPAVTADRSRFVENTSTGVYVQKNAWQPTPYVRINESEIHSNLGPYDLDTFNFYGAVVSLNFRDNWWGSADPDVFGPRIDDRRVWHNSPIVDWCRYKDGPGGAPVVDAHCPDLAVCGETEVLDLTDKPYQVTSYLYVCDDATLQIEPGVELLAAAGSPLTHIQADGNLIANGTAGDPVTITSDDAVPQPADWYGIKLTDTATATLDHTDVSYAEKGLELFESATATLDGVALHHNTDGLFASGYGPAVVTAVNSSFTDNAQYGISLTGYLSNPNPDVSITRSEIHSNGGGYDYHTYSFSNPYRTVMNVRENWWGTTDPMAIGPRIKDHRTHDSLPIIDWCRFLDGPGGEPTEDVHCPDLAVCDGPVTFDLTDRPYQITTDLHVCGGETLTVGPGVEMQTVVTTPRPDFDVRGTLDVDGTYDAPARFTSAAPTPQAGDWGGLQFRLSSVSEVAHAEIDFAEYGIGVYDDADVTLIGVAATDNTSGLFVQDLYAPPAQVRATGCSFTANEEYGVQYAGHDPFVSVTGSAVHSNRGAYDLFTSGPYGMDHLVVWATDNWWGTTDEQAIRDRIRDHDDSSFLPWVHSHAFGDACDVALGGDLDRDGLGDVEDNCPGASNVLQPDADGDLMGDACDPEPATPPSGACDGIDDVLDGYADLDGDGWGDPCDLQPTRADSHPGAVELCDVRDNDGDGRFGTDEQVDADFDRGAACGDCDDTVADVHVCACELCFNAREDDCDGLADGADADCEEYPTCVVLTADTEPGLTIGKGECGGAELAGPYDVVRGDLGDVQLAGSSVDLGDVICVEGGLDWDRVTERSARPNRACDTLAARYFLARNTGDADFGAATGGQRRDLMNPDPACP